MLSFFIIFLGIFYTIFHIYYFDKGRIKLNIAEKVTLYLSLIIILTITINLIYYNLGVY